MSKPDTWMPLYVGDYIADTMHLNTEQHGAYLLLLMTAWNRGGMLPSDESQLALICRADKKAWAKLRDVVLPFFELEDGQYVQRRLLSEYIKAVKINDAQKANGAKGGRPKKTQTETQNKPTGFDRLNPNETPSPSPTPLTTKTDNVDESTVVGGAKQKPAVALAMSLISWEKSRGKFPKVNPADPRLQEWVEKGVTQESLRMAYEMAIADREAGGDGTAVNIGFLDVFLAQLLNPGPSKGSSIKKPTATAPWFMTATGIEDKAKEIGIEKQSGERFYVFRERVYSAAGVTEDMVRRAKIDAGERP